MEYQDFLYEFTHTSDHEIKFYDKKMDKVISVDSSIYFLVNVNDKFDLNQFLTEIGPAITNISTLVKVFSEGHGQTFWKTWQIFSVIYLAFAIIGIIKARPKHEYTDIEHGSSDWSEGGEQYKILSKNKGIILAQDNYLPIDKRGNVNVLVVGRFWFW